MIAAALARAGVRAEVTPIGLTSIPACGSNADVLKHHGLDAASIAQVVRRRFATRELTADSR
jgi:transketolase